MNKPWEINPDLHEDSLKKLAGLIREIRDEVIDLHDNELGDTARGTGLRAYECVRSHINRASVDNESWPELGIIKPDGKFTFSINSIPIRLYRGTPSCPEEKRLVPCYEALSQMSFLYDEVGDYASTVWFFAVELDDYRYVDKVTFTGFLNGTQICCWEIPLDASVPVLAEVNDDTPAPVKLPKATVKLKVNKDKISNENS
jgi:hypothetical protein